MADTAEQTFSFLSDALPQDAFRVVSFQGEEGISRPYAFEVLLLADDREIDPGKVLENRVRLIIHRPGLEDVVYHGILAAFEQRQAVEGKALYRASLVPKLWWLSLTRHNQIFLDKTVREIVAGCLKDGGLTDQDYEFRLQGSYASLEYVCQYGESHLDFLSRWLEREGIYYFFEQTAGGEKIVFTDTRIAHAGLPLGKTLFYSPPSGLEAGHKAETIRTLTCRCRLTPANVLLKDYNYEKPSLDLTGSAVVSVQGRGQVYTYNEHFGTTEEGNRLAGIRAEALSCRREEFRGESSVPFLLPGFTFDLETHYRESYNRNYLIVDVRHEGNQPLYLLAGLEPGAGRDEAPPVYRNTFTAIKASAQFRPEQKTVKPRIAGTIMAHVDAEGSGQYAELDEEGRYKVVLPFDLSGRGDGKGSAWVRMAQPYAGSGHGMHFPLHKGTEVLLTFIDGDPDRPVIAAAVPNPETPSPVGGGNQTMAAITTGGDNRIHLEDKEGSERILTHVPRQQSFIRIGAHNDPPPAEDKRTEENFGVKLATRGALDVTAETSNKLIFGEETETICILYVHNTLGLNWETVIGLEGALKAGGRIAFAPLHHECNVQVINLGEETISVAGDGVKVIGDASRVEGEKTTVVGTAQDVTGDDTTVKGNATTVSGQAALIEGNVDSVSGERTRVVFDAVNVTGARTKVWGRGTTVSGAHTTVAGGRTNVTGGQVRVTGDNTTVSGNVQNVNTDHMVITGQAVVL